MKTNIIDIRLFEYMVQKEQEVYVLEHAEWPRGAIICYAKGMYDVTKDNR